jgi:hypothetical protein
MVHCETISTVVFCLEHQLPNIQIHHVFSIRGTIYGLAIGAGTLSLFRQQFLFDIPMNTTPLTEIHDELGFL